MLTLVKVSIAFTSPGSDPSAHSCWWQRSGSQPHSCLSFCLVRSLCGFQLSGWCLRLRSSPGSSAVISDDGEGLRQKVLLTDARPGSMRLVGVNLSGFRSQGLPVCRAVKEPYSTGSDGSASLSLGSPHYIHQFRDLATLFGFVTGDDRVLDAVSHVIA
jgi:hypothetical protein